MFILRTLGKSFERLLKKVRDDLYIDDLVTPEESINKVKNFQFRLEFGTKTNLNVRN